METLQKEKAIEWLETLEIGIPLVVKLSNNIRCVSLFAGKEERGYMFFDGKIFILSQDYIMKNENVAFITELGEEEFDKMSELLISLEKGEF